MYHFLLFLLFSSCLCIDSIDDDASDVYWSDSPDQQCNTQKEVLADESLNQYITEDLSNSRIWSEVLQDPSDPTFKVPVGMSMGRRIASSLGLLKKANPNDPYYRHLADESLEKYVIETGTDDNLKVTEMKRVTVKEVDKGLKVLIDFSATGDYTCDNLECTSELLLQDWTSKPLSYVSCASASQKCKPINPGGQETMDPNFPEYIDMAQQALNLYRQEKNIIDPLEVLNVTKVTSQVVAGILTELTFNVVPNYKYRLNCTARILRGVHTSIGVKCDKTDQPPNLELLEQNPRRPEYLLLAEQALQKYVKENHVTDSLKVAKVKRVLKDVAYGLDTVVYYDVSGAYLCDEYRCVTNTKSNLHSSCHLVNPYCESDLKRRMLS